MKISPVLDRFWSKVKKTSNCWVWTGCKKQVDEQAEYIRCLLDEIRQLKGGNIDYNREM